MSIKALFIILSLSTLAIVAYMRVATIGMMDE
jgi:hypothetical protein